MRLAVIGTFYRRHENSFSLLHRLYVDSTYTPDEAWLMCEDPADAGALIDAYWELYDMELLHEWPEGLFVIVLRTPRDGDAYRVIPYSNKINWALDRTTCDAIVYLDNGSMPAPEKFELMLNELRKQRGAVYCTQQRTGFRDEIHWAHEPIPNAYCQCNYTQVMHEVTDDRWSLDMRDADPDLADAKFWVSLHASLGPFLPVKSDGPLDFHHIPSPKAVGL